MARNKGEAVDPNDGAQSEPEVQNEEIQRFHKDKGGLKLKVLETYYDPRENVVKDVVEVVHQIAQPDGSRRRVALKRIVMCQDESIQARFRRNMEPTMVSAGRGVKIDE